MLWSILVIALNVGTGVYGYGQLPEIRIDDDPSYAQYQDVVKALKAAEGERSFSMYRTYRRYTMKLEHRCLYSKQAGKIENNTVPFEMAVQLTGKPVGFKYPTKVVLEKTLPDRKLNALRVVHPGEEHPILYRLIYSTYKGCDVMRVHLHNEGTANDCEIFLKESLIPSGVPRNCKQVYKNACGSRNISVFDKDCLNLTYVPLPRYTPERPGN